MSTFISVGNSEYKFDRLFNSLAKNIDYLPKPILYQYGHSNKIKDTNSQIDQINFLSLEEYYKTIKNSKLFISHLGAGSLINSIKFNIKSIFLSRRAKYDEHIDDHQYDLYHYLKNFKKFNNVFICENKLNLSIKKLIESDNKKFILNTSQIIKIVDQIFKN
tara:strand:+ start:414 stop:899 length:486 start_codon:yes stop_codon:yes gene_type:complete